MSAVIAVKWFPYVIHVHIVLTGDPFFPLKWYPLVGRLRVSKEETWPVPVNSVIAS